jgi:hypothetical protein
MNVGEFKVIANGSRAHRVVFIEELAAENEEFGADGGASDLVQELAVPFGC